MAAPAKDEKEKVAPIIVKKIIKKGGGHHGGAWKVAYADFVTAMMAFFLLLWLLNVTTKEQKNAISDFFDPAHPKVSDFMSGAGGVMGGMIVSPEGAMVTNVQPVVQSQERDSQTHGELSGIKAPEGQESDKVTAQLTEELKVKEDKRFEAAAAKIKAEIAKTPELQDLQKNILIDITPEGLRIQIVDDKGRSMFPSGSAQMYDFMRQILLKVSGVITTLPNQVSVRGHTDSNKYRSPGTYDNWNLSADRAQASRRVLVIGGLPEMRVENVMGRAEREPLDKDPAAARNRRISIILLRKAPTAEELKQQKDEDAKAAAEKAAVEGQKGVPVTIIDDTIQGPPNKKTADKPADGKTPAPDAQPTPKDGRQPPASAPKAQYNQPEDTRPQNATPLPVTPSPENFARQPQVMYFGDDKTNDSGTAPLYEGPTVVPIQKHVQQIETPVFHLDETPSLPVRAPDEKPAEKTVPAPVLVVPATPAKKTISFGDAVPAQAAPLGRAALPPAPALELDNSKSGPVPAPATPQVLQFGDAPAQSIIPSIVPPVSAPKTDAAPAPSAPAPDLELVNPAQEKRPSTAPAISLPDTPIAPQQTAPSTKKGQQLQF